MNKVKPIVNWAGGKSRLLKHLMPLVPECECYVEVFGGGAALLLAKERGKLEVWNDVHGDLVNLFRQAKCHPEELCRELEFLTGSRAEFATFLEQPGVTEIQRAARWFFLNKCSFGGMCTHFGTGKKGGGASHASKGNWLAAIRSFSQRFDAVCVESLDWKRCVDLYDGPETFFFFDPPYVNSGKTTYDAWGKDEMLELRERIDGLKGGFLLTTCDSPQSRAVFSGLKIRAITRANGIEKRLRRSKTGLKYKELIITKQ